MPTNRRSKQTLQQELTGHKKTPEQLRQRDLRLQQALEKKELDRQNMKVNVRTGATVRI